MHKGSCLCGSISYELDGELSDFGYCHCRSCRKSSGSAFGANAGADLAKLTLSDPKGFLRKFESSAGKIRAFCSNCGSPLYAYLARTPEAIRMRLGTLDTEFAKRPGAHIFVSDKAEWDEIHDALPRFNTWPSREVIGLKGSKQP